MPLPTPKENTTALVTGASSGIGAEIARELARRGHGVTLVARREDRLKTLADELAVAHEVRAEVIAADLTDADSRGELPGQIEARGLSVDILVNNAGLTTMGPVQRADRAAELAMVRTDVEAVVDLCTLFVAGMVTRQRGAVLNTASTAAFQPLPGQAGYGASKAFVLSYGRALGAELRGTGVTVTTLCPGPVETGFAESAGLTDAEASESLPKFMWVPAAGVAKAAVEGLAAGRPVVIPGAANRAGAAFAYLAPKALILPLLTQRHPALKSDK
ncbi:MAG TPA: SDR family oxidoreductase [Acidimicrobiales bacterium]|jgi:short-subunit dehydrogenase|nr:SDR family oxidoreductase [Acidimicrobiales bacterium]